MFVILDYTGDVVGEVMNGDRLFDHLDYEDDEILFDCRTIAKYETEDRVKNVFNLIYYAFNTGKKQFSLPTN